MDNRVSCALVVLAVFATPPPLHAQGTDGVIRFARYEDGGRVAYGIVEGERIREIRGDVFGEYETTDRVVDMDGVRLLPPTDPSKIIAVGLNYRSHLGNSPVPEEPGLFAKYPSSLVGHGDEIVLPPDSRSVHYEGELVLVIGRRAKSVPEESAHDYVFAVTAGNDVSERLWQAGDLQWLRAKAADTFGPVGPVMVRGLNPDDLLVETRVNGEVRQSERSSDLIHGVAAIVSYVSRYITLEPGDLIFTGTPGRTRALQPGDVVEIEVEGVGVLRNPVVGG